MAEHDVEAVWHDFWVPVIDKASEGVPMRGFVSLPLEALDQIKKELFDYHHLISGLPRFFDDITGGKCSNPNTDLDVVHQLVEERIDEDIKEAVEEALDIAQIDADENSWQRGYDEGYGDGHERGFEAGIDEARNRI